MKKVEATANIKRLTDDDSHKDPENWVFFIDDEHLAIQEIVQQWVKSENAQEVALEIRITSPHQMKTRRQLGYFHAEILPKITKGYQWYGNEYDRDQIYHLLKLQFFSEQIYDPILDTWERQPKSLAEASKEEMMQFIDECLRFADDAFPEIHIEDPEAYKRRKGISDAEWETEIIINEK